MTTDVKTKHHCQAGFAAIAHQFLQIPSASLDVLALHIWPNRVHHGIKVMALDPQTRVHFDLVVATALDLIKVNDPRRFGRVQREITAIIHAPNPSGGHYTRLTKVVTIDLRHFMLVNDQDLEVRLVACAIVCFATSGHFYRSGGIPTRRDYLRVSQACYAETVRFAKRIGLDYSPWDTPPEPRDSFLTRLRAAWKEILNVWRSK